MMSTRLWRRVAVVGVAFALVPAVPSGAWAAVDPGPVSPGQFFTGFVNGAADQSRIVVTCDGPIDVVPLGHPVPGQTVIAEQLPAGATPSASPGFTGSAARSLDVRFSGSTTSVTVRFYHASAAIPTTALVPCSGSGVVTFAPGPESRTARSATVTVTFVPSV